MTDVHAKPEPKASMEIRVYRAATDTWEEPIKVPCAIEDTGDPDTLMERLRAKFGLTKPRKD